VVSLNLQRRHLSESQRAMVAAKLANIKNTDFVGNQHSANLQSPQTSRAEAAALLKVSERTVNTAKKVEQNAVPELIKKVEQGIVLLVFGVVRGYTVYCVTGKARCVILLLCADSVDPSIGSGALFNAGYCCFSG
jgi:hypothetical protein